MCLLLKSGFRLATLPYRPDWWIAAEMVVLLEGFPHSTEERWSSDRVTIGFLLTSLTKALLPQSLSLDGRPALGRVLVVPDFFHLRMMEATVLIGTFKAADIFLYPSPDLFLKTILSRRSTDHSFDFMLGLCSDMHCQLGNLSKSCPINWVYHRWTPIVETSQGWSVETGCTRAQFWASWQRLWILMYMWFLSFLFLIQKKTCFTLSLWDIVCRSLKKKMKLIHFGIRL